MMNLLLAHFARLKKDKVFWLGMFVMFGLGIFLVVIAYVDMQTTGNVYILEERIFWYPLFIGVILSVFCSLFIGTEYSDGTIRNQLIIGHSRVTIYLANLIICIIAGLSMCLAYLVSAITVGIVLLGSFQASTQSNIMVILCSFSMMIAYVGIYTLIAMINHNKATVAVLSLLVAFAFIFLANHIANSLSEPELYNFDIVTEEKVTETNQKVPNPDYLSGMHRTVYQFLDDILPGNQAIQLIQMRENHLWQMMLYDGMILIVTTGIGIILLKQKDIK